MIILEKFSYETNGYNRDEVNKFINDVIVQTENIVSRCKKQRDEIESLKKELEHYRNLEKSLNMAILRQKRLAIILRKWLEMKLKWLLGTLKVMRVE